MKKILVFILTAVILLSFTVVNRPSKEAKSEAKQSSSYKPKSGFVLEDDY